MSGQDGMVHAFRMPSTAFYLFQEESLQPCDLIFQCRPQLHRTDWMMLQVPLKKILEGFWERRSSSNLVIGPWDSAVSQRYLLEDYLKDPVVGRTNQHYSIVVHYPRESCGNSIQNSSRHTKIQISLPLHPKDIMERIGGVSIPLILWLFNSFYSWESMFVSYNFPCRLWSPKLPY